MKEQATNDTKTCPKCAETIKAAAVVCRFCHHSFEVEAEKEQPAKICSKELMQQAQDIYNKKCDVDSALKLFGIIILCDAESQQARDAQTFIRRRLVSKEILEKASRLQNANDLSGALVLYKLYAAMFNEDSGAEYANKQIEALSHANVDYAPDKILAGVSAAGVASFESGQRGGQT